MTYETVIEKDTKAEYQVLCDKTGENPQKCPACSDNRKKGNENKKCFSYNSQLQTGHCQNCGITVYVKKENYKSYVRPEWKNTTGLPDNVVEWFQSRNIKAETLELMKITKETVYMPQVSKEVGCVAFNYFRDGHLINVKYRDKDKNFRLVKDAEKIFYNLDGIKDRNEVWIVEGEMDCLTMIQAGLTNTVSVPNGATKSNNKLDYLDSCWKYFENVEAVYILTDMDEAGNMLADELARRIGLERCYRVTLSDFKDVNEVVCNGVQLSRGYLLELSKPYPLLGVYEASNFYDALIHIRKNGFPKGWKPRPPFGNNVTIHPGYTSIITGIPGHGKSEHLDQVLIELNIDYDLRGAFFTPENWPTEVHLLKLVEKIAGQNFWSMPEKEINEITTWINDCMYWVYPGDGFDLKNMLEHIRKAVLRYGINWYVLDPWNKLDHQYTGPETKYISESLDMISNFNKKYNVHGFLIAHPTKMSKDRETDTYEVPNLYSISGSAHFFNKADLGWTVYKKAPGQTDVHVQKVKQKFWGEVGMISYLWDGKTGRYYTVNPDYRNWIFKKEVPQTMFNEPKENNDDLPF